MSFSSGNHSQPSVSSGEIPPGRHREFGEDEGCGGGDLRANGPVYISLGHRPGVAPGCYGAGRWPCLLFP